ncbi:MAG: phosphoribosyltransferase family protein [Gaiellaceae bacterium]
MERVDATGRITVLHDRAVEGIVRRCYSDVEVRGRDGQPGRGFTNLKRIFGWPAELRVVIDALAATVGDARAVASADSGSAPLVALIAYKLGLPGVFVRTDPKSYFLSYGGDPATTHPRLSGERLVDDTPVHVIDDFVHSGATLASAVETLREAGLVVQYASSLLSSPPEGIAGVIETIDIQLTVLVLTTAAHGGDSADDSADRVRVTKK